MDYVAETAKFKELLEKAKNVLIVTHERPTADSIGSSLALYMGLVNQGKTVTVACPDPITVELSNFIGVNKVVSEVGKQNFVISLDYVDGSIEKVSYNIDGDTFNLVIEPRSGFEPFTPGKVHFASAGINADCIVTIDTIHLGGLKKLYEADKELFASKPVINVDRHPNNAHFGQYNLVDPQVAATAEIVHELLTALGVAMTQDIATNLLNALFTATDGFQSTSVSARTFQIAADCMAKGAKRFVPSASVEELPREEEVRSQPLEQLSKSQKSGVASGEAPAEWLKPKIFKSSNLL